MGVARKHRYGHRGKLGPKLAQASRKVTKFGKGFVRSTKKTPNYLKHATRGIRQNYNQQSQVQPMDPAKARRMRRIFKSTKVGLDQAEEILGKEGFTLDRELSQSHGHKGLTGLVFTDNTGHPHVVHNSSQTAEDFGIADPAIFLGRGKKTARYRRGEALQRATEKKYGRDDVHTWGHSLGGWLAANVGTKGRITTYNRVSEPGKSASRAVRGGRQEDIRSQNDLPSLFVPDHEKRHVIHGSTYGDPYTTHIDTALKNEESRRESRKKSSSNPWITRLVGINA